MYINSEDIQSMELKEFINTLASVITIFMFVASIFDSNHSRF